MELYSNGSDNSAPVELRMADVAMVPTAQTAPEEDRAAKEKWKRVLLRVIVSLAAIAVGIFIILFCVAKAAQYDSISSMLQHMGGELALMWQRIIA